MNIRPYVKLCIRNLEKFDGTFVDNLDSKRIMLVSRKTFRIVFIYIFRC